MGVRVKVGSQVNPWAVKREPRKDHGVHSSVQGEPQIYRHLQKTACASQETYNGQRKNLLRVSVGKGSWVQP